MARLTWEQVAAPDFRGSIEGIKVASELLGSGFAAARQGIDKFEDNKTASASNAVMLEMLKFQKPEDVQAALAAGTIGGGVNPRYLNKDAMASMAGRANELMEQESGLMKLGQQRQGDKDFDFINSDENRAIVNAYGSMIRANDGAGAKALLDANPGFRDQVNPDVLNKVIAGGQDLYGQALGSKITGTNFDNSQDDRETVIAGETIIQKAIGSGLGERFINSSEGDLEKVYGRRAVDRALAHFRGGAGVAGAGADAGSGAGSFDGIAGGMVGSGGGSGIGIGGRNIHDVILGDQPNGSNSYGFKPSKPVSQMTMGELYDYQRKVMVPTTAAKGVGKGQGSSAAGAFQIVSKTLASAAPQVLGANWRELPFNAANQEKIAQLLFQQADKKNLHKVWEGLPKADYTGKSWAEVRDLITSKESGGTIGNGQPQASVADPRRSAVAQEMATKHSISENELVPLAVDLQTDWAFTGTADEVARRLTKGGGTFEGEQSNYVLAQIKKVQSKYGIKNPAVAGRLLARGKDGEQSLFGQAGDFLPGADGLKSSINWDTIGQYAKVAKDRDGLTRLAVSLSDKATAMQGVAASNALVTQIRTARAAAEGDAMRTGRGFDKAYWDMIEQNALDRQGGAVRGGVAPAMDGVALDTGPDGSNKVRKPAPKRTAAEVNRLMAVIRQGPPAALRPNRQLTPAQEWEQARRNGGQFVR